jgi:cytochrome c-type biogenesis protein CcmH
VRASRRRLSTASLVLVAAVLAAGAALAFVALRGAPPPRTLQDRVRAVGETLRCPVCEDLSVADSPSAVAGEIRADLARRLRAGESPDRIRHVYVERYGPRILLSPPVSGATLLAWLIPAVLLAAGLAVAAGAVVRWTRGSPVRDPSFDAADPLDAPTAPPAEDGTLPPADRRLLDRAMASFAAEDDAG